MSGFRRRLLWLAGTAWRIFGKEFRQNLFVYLSPLLFFIPLCLFSRVNGHPLVLGAKASVASLLIAFIFAVIYGLQSFAGETDRKTLDFLLSRPVSPTMLIVLKYAVNLGFYLLWLYSIAASLKFDWSLLHLPKGVEVWLVLALSAVVGMGFLAGLITRGAERLVVTVGLAGLLTWGCHAIWDQAFQLMAADYYWFDIPPHIVSLVSWGLPVLLSAVALTTPPVFALWFIRGMSSLVRFGPFRRLTAVWSVIIIGVWAASAFLGPAVWPVKSNPRGGDWDRDSGVAIAGSFFKKDRYPVDTLYIARIGGRARPVYKGSRIYSPRWSPDGKRIAFVDGRWIKVWENSRVKKIVPGDFPFWSHDGKNLAFVRRPDNRGRYSGVYSVNLISKKTKLLFPARFKLLGLAWDSQRQRLYLLHQESGKAQGLLEAIDLRAHKIVSIQVPTPVVLYMQNPCLALAESDGSVLLGVMYEHWAQVYTLPPNANQLILLDESMGHWIDPLSQAILSPTGRGYLVPRLDGAYDYRGIIPPHRHHPGDEDEDEAG